MEARSVYGRRMRLSIGRVLVEAFMEALKRYPVQTLLMRLKARTKRVGSLSFR